MLHWQTVWQSCVQSLAIRAPTFEDARESWGKTTSRRGVTIIVDHAPDMMLRQLHLLNENIAARIMNMCTSLDLEKRQKSAS
jgi:hypothetical protein